MALTLVELIAGAEYAQSVQLWIEYDPQPPHDTGSVAKAGEEMARRTVELVKAAGRRG